MNDEDPEVPCLVQLRRRRDTRRAKVIAGFRLTREDRRVGLQLQRPEDAERPRTRGDCAGGPRPCPWISCAHHLYLDVVGRTLVINHPDVEVWEMRESCALDVADRGGATLEEIGEMLGITRERTRQIEVAGLRKAFEHVPAKEAA